MKSFWYTVGAVVIGLLLYTWLVSRRRPTDIQTRAQRDAQSNATLDAYSTILTPIAQLERVPWTQTNLRMIDPVIQPPISLPLIPNNGGF